MEKLQEFYTQRIEAFNKQIVAQKSKRNLIFYSRLFLFIAAFVLFFYLLENHAGSAFSIITFALIAFLYLLRFEIKTSRETQFLHNKIQVHKIELNLLNNNFAGQNEGNEFIDKHHSYVADLDIFGRKSIFQLLNRTSTYSGRIKLANWLLNPLALKEEIKARQEAIKELSEKREWCMDFVALGISNKESATDKDVIMDWINQENQFSSTFLKGIALILPLLTLSSLALLLAGSLDSAAFTMLFFLQLIIVGMQTKKINRVHDQLSRKFDSIEKYRALIEKVASEKTESALLNKLKDHFKENSKGAGQDIQQLKKLVDTLDARMNIMVAIILNGVLLWDLNLMQKIEKWRNEHKTNFLKWIDTIGEFDAFISLALYTVNHPDFTFPDEANTDFCIKAEDAGHPLINPKTLVKNNYHLEGLKKIDLLTGANMAGKSTFLRTIGTNLILAMIGAPVCAAKFKFTPILLFTSLRTIDSLQENESFFYAELKRLHLLIEHYKKGERVFFLLDEILKGTNSKDQHQGSVALLEKILKLNGTGIIATHDVELSKLSLTYPTQVRNLCFEITIVNDQLHFDYKMKEGVCKTMNASFLMKKMEITD